MRAIHVAGFPQVSDLSNGWARRGHARLTPLGPNDGGGILLRDLLDLPGQLYPVRGAGHYLNPAWDIRPLLLRILREAARHTQQSTATASAAPVTMATRPNDCHDLRGMCAIEHSRPSR